MLIKKQHRQTILKIFKIMDDSGDGQLGKEEIQTGFQLLLGEELSAAQVDEIMRNVDLDGNQYIDYLDFLIASVDFSRAAFLGYCKEAYRVFFNRSEEPLDRQEFSELLCQGKFIKEELIKQTLDQIDQDESGTISFSELVESFIQNLRLTSISPEEICSQVREAEL